MLAVSDLRLFGFLIVLGQCITTGLYCTFFSFYRKSTVENILYKLRPKKQDVSRAKKNLKKQKNI